MSNYRICPFPNCAELNDRDDEWCHECGRCLVPPGMQTSNPERGGHRSAAAPVPRGGRNGGTGFASEAGMEQALLADPHHRVPEGSRTLPNGVVCP